MSESYISRCYQGDDILKYRCVNDQSFLIWRHNGDFQLSTGAALHVHQYSLCFNYKVHKADGEDDLLLLGEEEGTLTEASSDGREGGQGSQFTSVFTISLIFFRNYKVIINTKDIHILRLSLVKSLILPDLTPSYPWTR